MINLDNLTNDTLLVAFKNLNKQGLQAPLQVQKLELYEVFKDEITKRMKANRMPHWNYSLYPMSIAKSMVDWDVVERVIR